MTKKIILLFLIAFSLTSAFSQNTFKAIIKDSETNEPIIGATVILEGTTIGSAADSIGIATIPGVPDGEQEFEFKFLGYEEQTLSFEFPLENNDPVEVFMTPEEDELEEVVISSTRSSRTIEDIPTRVEFIAGEELEEKSNMKTGDIRMLLSESTGIQTQQTSATSANASIRIQGLDGRYTQILKDGFPLYSGASSGLGLLQTPPLDLKQVEVIKGSASTLYGGGAIAGLVNLITKTPEEEREINFHINGTSAGGLDINGFYSHRSEKLGTTIFAAHNRNSAYDPADIGLTAIPKFERFVFNPKLFLYFNDRTEMNIGVNATVEDRIGGDIKFIQGESDISNPYFEDNETQRISSQLAFQHRLKPESLLKVRNSLSYYNRAIGLPDYNFEGSQVASFSELTYSHITESMEWVSGINLWTDKFTEKELESFPLRDYDQITYGAFVQTNWEATESILIEAGLRADYVVDYGLALLPRANVLFKINDHFTSRIGGGFGYKAPTIFTEESERIQYRGVLPIDENLNDLERSYGINADLNYKTTIGEEVTFSVNQLFFYTYLNHPLLLEAQPDDLYRFINATGHINTKGLETNMKFGYEDFKLYLGYTLTDTRLNEGGIESETTLTPKHRINSVLMFEVEEAWKVGLEAYYFSEQKLSDEATGKDYWVCGFMAEKLWEKISLYINFENFLDSRQTKFDTIYTGTITNPTFRDIYAPMDGFVINGGIKLRL